MVKKLLMLVCIFLLHSPLCFAQTGEEDFWHFYTHFYQDPSYANCLPFFEAFIKNVFPNTGNPVWRNSEEKLGLARFFSLLAKNHPELLRQGEILFNQSTWEQKATLLEVFKRCKDATLLGNLNRWAPAEEDDDRRIIIERAAADSDEPEKLWSHPIRTPEQLQEQWAYFFSEGNTRVAESCVELLSNTSAGFFQPGKDKSPMDPEIYPREQRLREETIHCLALRAARHPDILQALLTHDQFIKSSEGQQILNKIAFQVLFLNDAAAGQKIITHLLPQPENSETVYIKGALAALVGDDAAANATFYELEKNDKVRAEWLRGYQFICKQTAVKNPEPVMSSFPEGNLFLAKCMTALKKNETFGVYEIWNFHEIPWKEEDAPSGFFLKLVQPNMSFQSFFNSQTEQSWLFQGENAFLWNHSKPRWVSIENRSMYNQLKDAADLAEIQTILAENPTTTFNKLFINGREYLHAEFNPAGSSLPLQTEIHKFFPNISECKITKIDLFFDEDKNLPVRMEIKLQLTSENKKYTFQGNITRFFHPLTAINLNAWLKGL